MAEPFLLIDGYNLLHAAGLARKRYAQGQLEGARRQLLRYLARHLTPQERARTTVFFDAGDAPADVARQFTVDDIAVVFARPGGDADTEIEQFLQAHSAPRSARVVSSDHRIQKAARRRRADYIDSELFVAELEHRGPRGETAETEPRSAADPKFGGETSAGETDRWLEEFGDIPEAAELEGDARRWQQWADEMQDELDGIDLDDSGDEPA